MEREQLEVLQHSLGVDQYGRGTMYRNHYVGECEACWLLASAGLMTVHPASELTGGDRWFRVTEEGKAAMLRESPKPPKLSRSQERYRQYLDWADDDGGTFREFLRDQAEADR